MKLTLTNDDIEKINKWYKSIEPLILEKQSEFPHGKGEIYYGAIGGGLTYIIIPTSIGQITKVKETITNLELDLTDYDSW